jgi:putative phosphoesterase
VSQRRIAVGVVSDTHGLLRPEAIAALNGSDLIVHAGDIGGADILEQIRAIAPTFAVRGNVDTGEWAKELPMTEVVEAGPLHLYVLHDIATLDVDPRAAGFEAVIYGHSHRPSADVRGGVLYLNPGSIGPRRFTLPISLAWLRVTGNRLSHEMIELRV